MNKQTIAFVAGRSGGHIIPALTVAQQLKNETNTTEILFFTTAHPLDMAIIKKQGSVITKHVPLKLGNIPYFNIFKILVFLFFLHELFLKVFLIFAHLNQNELLEWADTSQFLFVWQHIWQEFRFIYMI